MRKLFSLSQVRRHAAQTSIHARRLRTPQPRGSITLISFASTSFSLSVTSFRRQNFHVRRTASNLECKDTQDQPPRTMDPRFSLSHPASSAGLIKVQGGKCSTTQQEEEEEKSSTTQNGQGAKQQHLEEGTKQHPEENVFERQHHLPHRRRRNTASPKIYSIQKKAMITIS